MRQISCEYPYLAHEMERLLNIESIMSTSVVTVKLDDNLGKVRDIFSKAKFHHLLVVEKEKLFGVLSDRDLLKALSPKLGTMAELPVDSATLNKKVHQIMTRKPISMHESQSVLDAIEIFEQQNISCIPIVDDNSIPVGIVSWRDVLTAFKNSISNEETLAGSARL